MGWFDAVTHLVQALAWPVAVVVLVLFFRHPLRKWFERSPDSVKFAGVEIKWHEERQEVIDSVTAELSGSTRATPESDRPQLEASPEDVKLKLRALAGKQPLDAMHSAISRVAAAVWMLFPQNVVETQPMPSSLTVLVDRARSESLISDATHNAVTGVGVMYQLAISDPNRIDTLKASEFLTLADAVLYVLAQEKTK